MADGLRYPLLLKPEVTLPGEQRIAMAHGPRELEAQYPAMAGRGGVVLQEYVPGDDGDNWMFDGYFDDESRCLCGFTARKLRQHPAGRGVCTAGVCEHNQRVLELSERFLGAIRYRGVVDIDYRWDRRDGSYKVLDVNPRLGGAFRLMVDRGGMDVARAMYLDLTGGEVRVGRPDEGRGWLVEAADLIASRHFTRSHGLRRALRTWSSSLGGVRELATFSCTDPGPFMTSMRVLVRDTMEGRRAR